MAAALQKKGYQDKNYLKLQEQVSTELMNIRFTARTTEAPVRRRAPHGRPGPRP